jgi:hypothetical protein
VKRYTWEEKIESLVKLAKAAGRYINSEETDLLSPSTRSDYFHDAQRKFREAYYEFCDWRHDEPYVVDEIKAMLAQRKEREKDA